MRTIWRIIRWRGEYHILGKNMAVRIMLAKFAGSK
jgi:hypothetical protein